MDAREQELWPEITRTAELIRTQVRNLDAAILEGKWEPQDVDGLISVAADAVILVGLIEQVDRTGIDQ